MTRIRFRFRRPDGLTDGGSSPRGLVVCSPTSRVVQKDAGIMLPLPFVARLPEDGGDLVVSLQPTGTPVDDGTPGKDGLGWSYGHGVPSSTGVPVGSLYLDLDTGNVYAFNA